MEPHAQVWDERVHAERDPQFYIGNKIGAQPDAAAYKKPQTGAVTTLQPHYRRKPPFFRKDASGEAEMGTFGVGADER